MYDHRILFPRTGSNEIRREMTARTAAAERRRRNGCIQPEQHVPEQRAGKERS